ncbi:MAG: transposase, partial [bacterium]
WASHSGLEPFRKLTRTIHAHRRGILRWFYSKMTNGLLEGINSLVQAAKAKARGYRSIKNLITMVYLIAGKLDFGWA